MIKGIIDKLKADKKAMLLLCLGILGVLLLVFSCFLPGEEKEIADDRGTEISVLERQTEKRLESILSKAKGVGKVQVCVTYECAEEYEYARNENVQGDGKCEKEFVLTGRADNESGLVLTVVSPKVRGVAICCEGGASPKVREDVLRLVCAALGVGASKVYVSPMK